ncbi:MAG: hypothetical protein LBT05_10225 [Planctomycetaceae bacterium]|jgi:hypothetical protein|nr:hypothetical protein [Planctomycetaceae bacterium]
MFPLNALQLLLPLATSEVMFDAKTLPPIPAPFWFVQFFKVLGFVLHLLAMNLWFAGLPLALLLLIFGRKFGRRFATRLFSQLPVIMAFGINFGIVPLLFLQAVYYKAFYTASILMAWHWIMIIPLVTIAYYSLYIAAFSVKTEQKKVRTFFAGLISTLCFLGIAYIFVSVMSLMTQPERMTAVWERGQLFAGKELGAATLGFGMNADEPTLWFRYGMIFGLALTTTAFWAVFDANILIPKRSDQSAEDLQKDDQYRRWAGWFALVVALAGGAISAACYDKYLGYVAENSFAASLLKPKTTSCYILYAALFTPFLAAIAIFATKIFRLRRYLTAFGVALFQLVALATFAVSRQWIQNVEVSQVIPIAQLKENTQFFPIYTSPLIAFLVFFVIGAIVIGWMIRQIVLAQDVGKV